MAADARRTVQAIQAIQAPQAIHDGHTLLFVFCILKRYGEQRRN